jgi:cell division protein FtsL
MLPLIVWVYHIESGRSQYLRLRTYQKENRMPDDKWKRLRKWGRILVIASVVIYMMVLLDSVTSMESDISSMQSDISSIQSDIESLQSDVSSIQGDVDSIQNDVSSIEINTGR